MIEVAEKLSIGIPQVRIDLYDVCGHIYFGEMTFFHWGGKKPFNPEEWDYKFGSWIKLPEIRVWTDKWLFVLSINIREMLYLLYG